MTTKPKEQTGARAPAGLKITELDHIVLRVRDMDASLAFYVEVLGLPPVNLEEFRSGEWYFPSVRLNEDTIIDLFSFSDMERVPEDAPRNYDHFCMVIESMDMDELASQLQARGVRLKEGPSQKWGARGDATSIYIYDPDDNVVELRSY